MWRDESVTYQVAHRSVGDIWALLGNIDAVHGLYYFIMHGVFAVWDGGLLALRLPSVIATALAAAGVGAIGRRLRGARTGVLAGTTYAAIPMVQHFAQEGRSYALVSAAVVWATYLFLRCLEGSSTRLWFGYTSLAAAAAWLHEFAGLMLAAHAVTLRLAGGAASSTRRSWMASAAASSMAVVPLAVVSAGQSDQQLGWLGRPSLAVWLQFFAIAAGGLLMSCYVSRSSTDSVVQSPSRPTLQSVAIPLLVLPGGLLMTLSLLKPWYVERYVLYSMAGLALLIGSTIDTAVRTVPWRRAGVALAACCLGLASLVIMMQWSLLMRSPESRKDDTIAVAHAVDAYASRGDAVLFMPARRREWLLSAPSTYGEIDDLALDRSPAASRTLQGTEILAQAIRTKMLKEDRIITLTDPPGQPLDTVPEEVTKRQVLAKYFERCTSKTVRGAQVTVYERGRCG
jgi:mannosyltransferase